MNELPSFSDSLLQRFLSYVKIYTTSDADVADSGLQPSTERQWNLVEVLETELGKLAEASETKGEIYVTEYGYVCARFPATEGLETVPSVCFLAHMDTASDCSGENVKPVVHENYDGSIPFIKDGTENGGSSVLGHTIITSDGTTLLGADDKAGIAEIITCLEIINSQKIPHGQIEVIFSPDEETGHGMDNVPLDWLQSKIAYTVDGGELGEIECECFNAYKSEIQFTGIAVHTGSAKNKMINAVKMASDFVALLPVEESPEATEGYEGFFAPMSICGDIASAKVSLLLRDFTVEGMKKRISKIDEIASIVEKKYSANNDSNISLVKVTHTEQYKNMKEKLDEAPFVMENLRQAALRAGVSPYEKPIRGGTDGSRLTELGIPTPNIFTGGHNFHSQMEWSSLNQMCYTVKTIIELVQIYVQKSKV